MRTALIVAALAVSAPARGAVTFVAPLEGSQAVGPQIIEISTDAQAIDRVEFVVDGVLAGVARKPPFRIAYDFGTSLEARRITAKVLSDGYRRTETATVTTMPLLAGESINIDVVEVPLRVRTNRTLTAADFHVRESSVEQTIREVTPARGPAHFAFVVDRSLSMSGPRLAAALDAARDAASLLRPGDTASLVLFNHHVSAPVPLTSAVDRELTASGGTSLRDAVASTIGETTRTYVIVITDGGDRNSLLTDEAALRRLSGTKTILSAVVLGKAAPFLQRAVTTTGGSLLRGNAANVRQQVARIVADINSRYTLIYQSHGTKPGWRTIEIEARRAGLTIDAARKGYFAE